MFYFDNFREQKQNLSAYATYAAYTLKLKIILRFLKMEHKQSKGDSVYTTVENAIKGKVKLLYMTIL